MPFEKGTSGNKNGRPKGTPNKYTDDVKQGMKDILEHNLAKLQDDLDHMSEKDKWAVLMKISDKILPNLKSIDMEVKADVNNKSIPFSIDYGEEEKDNEEDNESKED